MAHWRHWPEILEDLDGVQMDVSLNYKKHTGDHIYGPTPPSFNDPGEQESRVGPFTAPASSRPRFYQMLLRQVARVGLNVEYNTRVKDYFEDASTSKGGVVFEDGSTETADIVLACDGHSTSSAILVASKPVEPKASGMAIFRTAYPKERAMQDPVVRERWQSSKPVWEFWLGPSMYMGVFITQDTVSWGFTPRDDGTATESWIPDVSPEEAIKAMGDTVKDWHPASTHPLLTLGGSKTFADPFSVLVQFQPWCVRLRREPSCIRHFCGEISDAIGPL